MAAGGRPASGLANPRALRPLQPSLQQSICQHWNQYFRNDSGALRSDCDPCYANFVVHSVRQRAQPGSLAGGLTRQFGAYQPEAWRSAIEPRRLFRAGSQPFRAGTDEPLRDFVVHEQKRDQRSGRLLCF
jgi:hypothetical protein